MEDESRTETESDSEQEADEYARTVDQKSYDSKHSEEGFNQSASAAVNQNKKQQQKIQAPTLGKKQSGVGV